MGKKDFKEQLISLEENYLGEWKKNTQKLYKNLMYVISSGEGL